ncbi:MAG: putative porin [Muribaculaceae bacterium]|nr:putative porin [Muribaculaceae bacterium]
MIAKRILILCIASLTISYAFPQQRLGRPSSGGQQRQTSSQPEGAPTDSVRQGTAWTLTFPLGNPVESTIDTLTYNFQRKNIPSMVSDAYATTGTMGAEGINLIYSERPQRATFFFQDALDASIPTFSKQKFYNVYVPTTILNYVFGGNKLNHNDRLSADFAGNVNRRIGIGASIDYIYSKGAYEAQALKNLAFSFSTYYKGDRYELQAFYNHFNSLNKENGGITDDLYITDPALLQGGINKIEPKSIPTRLNAAHTRLNGDELFMTHAWKVGFWKSENVNDTLTREVYVPMTRFIYSFDLQHRHHTFLNSNTSQAEDFWSNCYLDPNGSREETYLTQMTNSFGIELIEGFQKWAKFGLSAFISYQTQKYKQPTYFRQPILSDTDIESLTPLPNGFNVAPTATRNMLWVGGRLQKDKGSILKYAANARFGLIGDVVGDLELDGKINTRFKLFGDSVSITAKAAFRNTAQPYLLQEYISNHFVWDNDFGKTRSYKAGGELLIPWTKTTIGAEVENIQNLVYFNSESLPRQYGGNIQVFSAKLNQLFRVGILNWNNTVYYQKSSNESVLPLPQFAIYSNLFLKFIAFKVLTLQIGVDCDYYTRYNGLDYQPATMSFHVQGENPVKIGNYPFCNAYITARLYKTRFYVLWSHANQGMFSKESFILPHYPFNPRRLEFGLSVDFSN